MKEELVACVAVARQVGGHIPGVVQVITEIENCAATADNGDCVKDLLAGMQKPSLKLVSASTNCGNLHHKIAVLQKAIFAGSVENTRAMTSAFAKLSKAMDVVVELLLTVGYFDEGQMNWTQYTKDVYEAK